MHKTDLVQKIHQSPWKVVLALAGGGSRAIYDLLQIPGGSRTLLEAIVPYSPQAFDAFIGAKSEQYCSDEAARALAMAALAMARRQTSPQDFERLVGIGVTASLATDRVKRGEHRVFLALQTSSFTLRVSVLLEKDKRTRLQEEDLVADLILNLLSFLAFPSNDIPAPGTNESDEDVVRPLEVQVLNDFPGHHDGEEPLFPSEKPKITLVRANLAWTRLLFGHPEEKWPTPRCFLCSGGNISEVTPYQKPDDIRDDPGSRAMAEHFVPVRQAIFPGAFNPIHSGHLRILEIAKEKLRLPVRIELSVHNCDKLELDFLEIAKRLRLFRQASPDLEVYVSNLPRFFEKAAFFGPVEFIVGADTLSRIVEKVYYNLDGSALERAMSQIIKTNCRFLIFCRRNENEVVTMTSLPLPPRFRSLCEEIPANDFLDDISSTRERHEQAPASEDPFAC